MLQLEYVYGYNGDLLRFGTCERFSTNIIWLQTGEIMFPVRTPSLAVMRWLLNRKGDNNAFLSPGLFDCGDIRS